MLEKQLSQAFVLTSEEQAEMFERFANAFLIDDYPNWKVSVGRGISDRLVVSQAEEFKISSFD